MTVQKFDYIIVGAGSAGCVLAERLSASGKFTVAVVEAGGSDRSFWIQTPLGYGKTFWDRRLNWGYYTAPDPGLEERSDYWPRGKVLGGSSSLNAMVWIRGNPRDYDDWGKGWGFADLLPYFKAIETNQAGGDRWRGDQGEVFVSDVSDRLHPLAARFVAAGEQAGLAKNLDFNGERQEGIGVYQLNIKNGRRFSAARAFLHPALKRRNVTLFSRCLAKRIVIANQIATGVEVVERRGTSLRLEAGLEVIVCGGAVESPHLLELSGIGARYRLEQMQIGCVVDLPAVGENLQDHLGINYVYRSRIPSLNQELRPWYGKLWAGIKYLLARRGPLSLSLNQGGGFIHTRPGLKVPNIQLYCQAISTVTGRKGTRPLLNPDSFAGFAIGLSNCRTSSRGSIHSVSADYRIAPEIQPNSFAAGEDLRDMLEGVKFLRHLAAQPALAEVIAEEVQPGPTVQSDEQLIADFKLRSGTVYHPCGTCRLGESAADSVVDLALRVHGIQGLRVVDASVFPSVITGNTNAPIMAIAARAADLILEQA